MNTAETKKKIVGEPAMYIDAGDVNKSNIARYTNDGREVVTYRDKHKEGNYRGRNDNSNTGGTNDNRDCLHAEFEMCHLGSYCPHDNSNCQDKQRGNSPCINNSNNDSSDSGSDSNKIAYSAGNTVTDNNSDGCSNNKNNIETRNNALFCYVVTPAGTGKHISRLFGTYFQMRKYWLIMVTVTGNNKKHASVYLFFDCVRF